MATYKLIQDIEAEDHILGPLTLRQFIYSLAAAFLYYICFLVISKHVAVLLVIFLPPALFSSFLAFPFKRDQPTEVWALAKVRYLLKPRQRIWSQSGIKNLVTITVPKKVVNNLTKGLSQNEVNNRLKSLATMIDSRGWAIKNVVGAPADAFPIEDDNERLITVGSIPKPVLDSEIDIFSDDSTQTQHMNDIINHRAQETHQHLLNLMSQGGQNSTPNSGQVGDVSESSLSENLKFLQKQSSLSTSNLRTIKTPMQHSEKQKMNPVPEPKVVAEDQSHIDPSALSFALHNSTLSVQTLAKEVNKSNNDDNEVVVNLHLK